MMHTYTLLLALLGIAVCTDLASRRIPNTLVAGGLAAALMLQLFTPTGAGLMAWLLGAFAGLCALLPFYLARGMAAGDVKLMAMVGGFVGPLVVLQIALATFLIGGFWSLIVVLRSGRLRETLHNIAWISAPALNRFGLHLAERQAAHKRSTRLPYAVAIAAGTLATFLMETG